MKILIPTAKEMKFQGQAQEPRKLSKASLEIVKTLANYPLAELARFYKISPERAAVEAQRFEEILTQQAPSYPALYLFDGLMYRNIKREQLTKKEEAYLKEQLYITSSLYGLMSAFEPIAAHRLDFMGKLKIKGKSLRSYWWQQFDQQVQDDEVLISLLSSEFEQVFSKEQAAKLLRFKFLEEKDGILKSHSTISKKGRGQFLTCLMENQLTKVDRIKQLSFAGFTYRQDLSSPKEFVFVKRV